jgi:protein SCO1/2
MLRRILASLWLASALHAQLPSDVMPPEMEGVGVTERIGQPVDLDLTFIAENGYPLPLRQLVTGERPVILNLVYYNCPMLCNLVLNAQVKALRDIPWTPGREFDIVTISIDPNETFALASAKKQAYLAAYDKPAPGWRFLADHDGNVKKLAAQLGFRYRYDARQQQYIHNAVIFVLTPGGRVSRYLYGIQFKVKDLRLALVEASEGKFKATVDQLLLFCFHYDPQARSYVPFATNIMRAGGLLVVLVLGGALARLWLRERRYAAARGWVEAK